MVWNKHGIVWNSPEHVHKANMPPSSQTSKDLVNNMVYKRLLFKLKTHESKMHKSAKNTRELSALFERQLNTRGAHVDYK